MAEIKDCATCQLSDTPFFCRICKTHDGNTLHRTDRRNTEVSATKQILTKQFEEKKNAFEPIQVLIPKTPITSEQELDLVYYNVLTLMQACHRMMDKMPYFNKIHNNRPKG